MENFRCLTSLNNDHRRYSTQKCHRSLPTTTTTTSIRSGSRMGERKKRQRKRMTKKRHGRDYFSEPVMSTALSPLSFIIYAGGGQRTEKCSPEPRELTRTPSPHLQPHLRSHPYARRNRPLRGKRAFHIGVYRKRMYMRRKSGYDFSESFVLGSLQFRGCATDSPGRIISRDDSKCGRTKSERVRDKRGHFTPSFAAISMISRVSARRK